MSHNYLSDLLNAYWFAPPVALWRAIEVRVLARQPFLHPLLDLGCGDGLIAQVIFGREGSIDVGFDPWMSQLLRARRSAMYRHLDCANGQNLPYRSGSFSTVFSNSVLEHIPDPIPVVREAARVLEDGGRFIFTVPSDHFRRLLDGYVRRATAGDAKGAEAYAVSVDTFLEHHHYHSPAQWRALLSKCGLGLEAAEYYVPGEVVGLWDRMNRLFGIGRRRSAWSILASPRMRGAGYQRALRRLVVRRLSEAWKRTYQMDVADAHVGGGLLVVACKNGGQ
jgi:SAM-dependent methyltransferase